MKRQLPLLPLCLALLLSACGGAVPAGTEASVPPPREEPEPPTLEEPAVPEEPPPPEPTTATLAVCGDAMSHMPITNDAWNGERYDYARIMAAARPYVEAADYAVVNLETTLSGGPPYSGYPAFNSPDDLAYDLKALGFDLCLTANNHSLDRGFSGLSRTLDVLDEAGLRHVGSSRTQEEFDHNAAVADVGGISAAFLGYTYGTNGIPIPKKHPYAINVFNTDYLTSLSKPDWDRLAEDLEAAKALDTDLVAVMIHWGLEYKLTPNRYQEEMTDFLFENGADVILGGHSHVPQPMEVRPLPDGRQGFVCYSLGNFISSQTKPNTDVTAVLTLTLTRNNETGGTQVTDYDYVPLYMLHRAEGASPRFELVDIHAALESQETGESLRQKLNGALETCHAVFGEQRDAGK
ncbi:CapA family protein [Oscillibacter sp.]|uniref:CapA family protein n=1 Tax=Oscillibacter sp. TaxID=1945593 RepID=UPI002D7FC751|nr:CapA family protein [Oscillibacter sp.]